MEIQSLSTEQQLIVQMEWDENNIEFYSRMLESNRGGIFITPYMHEGHPLELNIDARSQVVCNLFADNLDDGTRVCWRNIKLETVEKEGSKRYYVTISEYNRIAQIEDRRERKRIFVHQNGELTEKHNGRKTQVLVHDVSDNGFSFFAPSNFTPVSNNVGISFTDFVQGEPFHIKIEGKIRHMVIRNGMMFCGCEVLEPNREYLLYGCMRRISKGKDEEEKPNTEENPAEKSKETISEVPEETEETKVEEVTAETAVEDVPEKAVGEVEEAEVEETGKEND